MIAKINKKPAKKKNLPEKKVIKKEKTAVVKNVGEENNVQTKGAGRTPALLRGMKDLVPKDEFFWKRQPSNDKLEIDK